MSSILFLLLIVVMFYVLLVRAPRQRVRRQQESLAALEVGDEIVTIGGIVGRITAFDGDHTRVEVAPGVELTFLRAGISRRLEAPAEDVAGDVGGNGDHLDTTDAGASDDVDGEGDQRRDGAA